MNSLTHLSTLRWPALFLLCVALAGCIEPTTTLRRERGSGAELVREADRGRPTTGSEQIHLVQQGDTLFRIAFRYQTTVDQLVSWNQIADRNRIQVGQRLRVSPLSSSAQHSSATHVAAVSGSTTTTTTALAPPDTSADPPSRGVPADALPVVAEVERVDPDTGVVTAGVSEGTTGGSSGSTPTSPPTAPLVQPTAPPVLAANTPSAPAIDPEATLAPPSNAASVPPAGSPAGITNVAAPTAVRNGWSWPAAGRLIGTFVAGDATRSGIDIAGNEGQAVYAAADGEVLFSGTGIIGYGELIVIQHPNGLLSAYGHSRKRLVNEGAKIKRGQQIAELGRDSSGRQLLHFEIRKAGKPVDPLAYLPGR